MRRFLRRFLKWTAIAVVCLLVLGAGAFAFAWYRSDNDCAARAQSTPERPMKAIVYCDYGSADVLKLETIERPEPADNQVLVRVHAASLNPLDMHYMRGTPYIMRLDGGLRKPKTTRLGVDFAGTVESVGAKVTRFKPGYRVFGGKFGAFSEYVAAAETSLAMMPENVTFDEAAGIRVAALTALQALRDKGQVQPGQKVLINGASGGVGTFAVQIAKAMGAHVTGVCSTRNVELVKSLGADEVIDYTRTDYTKGREQYDTIIDMVGNHGVTAHRPILKPSGTYVIVGGPKGKWIAPMDRVVRASVASRFGDQRFVFLLSQGNQADLELLGDMVERGEIRTVIDRRYPLEQTAEAMRHLETGRARGKIIITVAPGS